MEYIDVIIRSIVLYSAMYISLYLASVSLPMVKGVISSGSVWGITIPMTDRQTKNEKKYKIMLIISIIVFIVTCGPGLGSLLAIIFMGPGTFIITITGFVAIPVVLIIGSKHAKRKMEKMPSIATDKNALVLEQLPIIQKVNGELAEAEKFIVSDNGIGLFDIRNYCFAAEYYRDYRLGDLTTPREIALVAMYFAQKYGTEFSFEPTFEREFYPGKLMSSIGEGAVTVGRKNGSYTSTLSGYIFRRNRPSSNSQGQQNVLGQQLPQ